MDTKIVYQIIATNKKQTVVAAKFFAPDKVIAAKIARSLVKTWVTASNKTLTRKMFTLKLI